MIFLQLHPYADWPTFSLYGVSFATDNTTYIRAESAATKLRIKSADFCRKGRVFLGDTRRLSCSRFHPDNDGHYLSYRKYAYNMHAGDIARH